MYIYFIFSRKIESLSQSATSLSATCLGYQKSAIQLIQSLSTYQSKETCLQFKTEVTMPTEDTSCDLAMAKACVIDMADFLRSAHFEDKWVCR